MITVTDVEKIAKLAKLSFSDEQVASLAGQLASIVAMIDQIDQVDCEDLVPLTSALEMTQRLRKDEVTENDISAQLFNNTMGQTSEISKNMKCFIVPKVIE